MRDTIVGNTVTATGAQGHVIARVAAVNPEFDLYRIEFDDGSTDLFERNEFRQ